MRAKSNNNVQMAFASINGAKWRSFLTMLGVIIGVTSVVTIVSLGEGVKHQLTAQIKHTGTDLITVRGGRIVNRDSKGKVANVSLVSLFAGVNLNDADYQVVQKIPELSVISPFAVVPAVPKSGDGRADSNATVIATNHQGAQALKQDITYGGFFEERDNSSPVAVIGKDVAEEMFQELAPVGKSFELRGQKVVVRGVFQKFETGPLSLGVDYNNAIFIPYQYARELTGGSMQPYQILVRPNKGQSPPAVASKLNHELAAAHGDQTDFTVLEAKDNIEIANRALTVLTGVVSAIAAISLFVGGIGIMNIMLVAVSERTHEIGIRKSVGATNRQIMNQFLVEAVVIAGVGGVLGVLASLLVNYFLRVFTQLQPVITLPIMVLAIWVAVAVGVFFGITPALKAARKDPIEALRRT